MKLLLGLHVYQDFGESDKPGRDCVSTVGNGV